MTAASMNLLNEMSLSRVVQRSVDKVFSECSFDDHDSCAAVDELVE